MDPGTVALIIIGLFWLIIYMMPAIVAGARDHRQFGAILVLNLLLGWTLLGWIFALVWACMNTERDGDCRRRAGPYGH